MRALSLRLVATLIVSVALWSCSESTERSEKSETTDSGPFDVLLVGGLVIDPETSLDAVRDVGIRDGRIVAVSESSLGDQLKEGGVKIDAKGLVVAPGFIDLHAHA